MRDGGLVKPNTCLVVDVWEGQLEIDEAVLKSNGVAGIGIRLNDMNGGHHLDTNFWRQWGESGNFVRFPYFVYNPWVSGAANFAWLAANVPVEALALAVDIEVRKPGYSAASYASELSKFLELAKTRWKVIIYTAQWFLPYLAYWPKVDYWWAQYPDHEKYFGGVSTWPELKKRLDRLDKPFNVETVPGTLKMWQFSGDHLRLPGCPKLIDVNLFYGTEQDLADYFGTGHVVEPPLLCGLYQFSASNYFDRSGGPLTLPVSRARKLGDNLTRIHWPTLKKLLFKLNSSNQAAVDLIARPDWGPSKGRDEDYIKWIGLVWPGRNIVKVEEVLNDAQGNAWGRIDGAGLFINATDAPSKDHPDESIPMVDVTSQDVNNLCAADNPELVHMVYDYHRASGWGERNRPVIVPILGGPWWVEMNKLVSVDRMLPKIVKIRAFPRLNVRSGAGTDNDVIGYKYYGEGVMVEQVKLGKGGIWGKVSGGWIALRHNGTNWTDWII
jgi:hypothetical protein